MRLFQVFEEFDAALDWSTDEEPGARQPERSAMGTSSVVRTQPGGAG